VNRYVCGRIGFRLRHTRAYLDQQPVLGQTPRLVCPDGQDHHHQRLAEGRGASQGRSCREGVKALYSSGANQTLGTQLGGPRSTLSRHSARSWLNVPSEVWLKPGRSDPLAYIHHSRYEPHNFTILCWKLPLDPGVFVSEPEASPNNTYAQN
jgi:hypothetical protein